MRTFAVCPLCGYILPFVDGRVVFGDVTFSLDEMPGIEPCGRRMVVLGCEDPPYRSGDSDAQRAWMMWMWARADAAEYGVS